MSSCSGQTQIKGGTIKPTRDAVIALSAYANKGEQCACVWATEYLRGLHILYLVPAIYMFTNRGGIYMYHNRLIKYQITLNPYVMA